MSNPLTFTLRDSIEKFTRESLISVGTKVACAYIPNSDSGMGFYFFDIFDAHAGKKSNLGVWCDTQNHMTDVLAAFADTTKSQLVVVGGNQILIYGYESSDWGSRVSPMITTNGSKRFTEPHIWISGSHVGVRCGTPGVKTICLWSANGRLLVRTNTGSFTGGDDHFTIIPLHLSSGVYLCTVEDVVTGQYSITKFSSP
jgi:hypothetical protein